MLVRCVAQLKIGELVSTLHVGVSCEREEDIAPALSAALVQFIKSGTEAPGEVKPAKPQGD